jgi:large subunit ribosomal protein L29
MNGKEVRKLRSDEVAVELARLRSAQFDSATKSATEKIENTAQLKKNRRDIARLLTRQRQDAIGAKK